MDKQDVLKNSLTEFFQDKEKQDQMLPILLHKSRVSLRVLSWFVRNYAKKHHIVYDIIKENGETEKFDVFRDYKSQLKAFSIKRFDPFCRFYIVTNENEKIKFGEENPEMKCIETRIRQLNFFRWAIMNRVLDYVENHFEDIETDMMQSVNQ